MGAERRLVATVLCVVAVRGVFAHERATVKATAREQLANARAVHDGQRARFAAVPPAPEDADVLATRAAATAALEAEARSIAAADEALAGADDADVQTAVRVAAGSLVIGGNSLAAFERAVTNARVARAAREGGARVVPALYFVPGTDRFRPTSSWAALDELARLLDTCPGLAIEFIGGSADGAQPASPRPIAAGRAGEMASYLVQTGTAPERILGTRAATAAETHPEPLGLPLAFRPTPPADAGEAADIVVVIVRRCP